MAISNKKLAEIQAWLKDFNNYPSQQGIYKFSTANSYYEELSQIYAFLVAYKEALDELEESEVSQEELDEAIATLEEEISLTYAKASELEDYVLKADASGYTDILTKTLAESTYETLADASLLDGRITVNEGDISDLKTAVSGKQDTLTAGTNIQISNNVISATGEISTDWSDVSNQPLINGESLASGNNTLASLGIQAELTAGTDYVVPATLNDYVAKADATGYGDILTQTSASSTYVAKADATGYNDILTQTSAQATYSPKDKTFTNITVSGTPVQYTVGGVQAYPDWDSNEEYGYFLDITVVGITANDIIDNFVAPTGLIENIGMYAETGTDNLRLWFKDATAVSSSIMHMATREV